MMASDNSQTAMRSTPHDAAWRLLTALTQALSLSLDDEEVAGVMDLAAGLYAQNNPLKPVPRQVLEHQEASAFGDVDPETRRPALVDYAEAIGVTLETTSDTAGWAFVCRCPAAGATRAGVEAPLCRLVRGVLGHAAAALLGEAALAAIDTGGGQCRLIIATKADGRSNTRHFARMTG